MSDRSSRFRNRRRAFFGAFIADEEVCRNDSDDKEDDAERQIEHIEIGRPAQIDGIHVGLKNMVTMEPSERPTMTKKAAARERAKSFVSSFEKVTRPKTNPTPRQAYTPNTAGLDCRVGEDERSP